MVSKSSSFSGSAILYNLLLSVDFLFQYNKQAPPYGLTLTKDPQIIEDYKKKLEAKMEEILSAADIDKNRIASEVIIYAEKVCVDEETVRLRSHIEHARKCLNEDGGIGRKMDFIAQEMQHQPSQ